MSAAPLVRPPASVPLRLTAGARTMLTLHRRLHRVGVTLAGGLSGAPVTLPPLADAEGWLVTALPVAQAGVVAPDGSAVLERQRYARRYVDLTGRFDAYLAGLSPATRASLRRKARRLANASGGTIAITAHHDPASIHEFYRKARGISRLTYQERLLDAGLPTGDDFIADMQRAAAAGRLRAWLLHIGGRAAAYLYCPAVGDTLLYAYLGHDPTFAALSPGTVLQYSALEALFAEQRFARFDFTEGDGQHKRQFATGAVPCVDLLILRRSPANLAVLGLLGGFDQVAALAKRCGAGPLVRPLLR
ncbi:GNAT family N-acetyltransferase [Sphingomonas flavalba]|uniref:GNAT family N-acetyltransferase n=1 Tax=Sphingomonas flavalba TaxID=2559804 RepID=UPI001EF0EE1D|nr:GNAT family N-acetyltransferase [Sphingomonas flavalba]